MARMREFSFNAFFAAIGTTATACLGGFDASLKVLIAFMVIDYLTGFLGAVREHKVNSEVMYWGGIRKGIILAILVVSVLLDEMVGNSEPIFRTLTIYFYISREGISVIENTGVLGVPWPSAIAKVLSQLQEKGEEK
jgi:toxin secretion/phage lysis holin